MNGFNPERIAAEMLSDMGMPDTGEPLERQAFRALLLQIAEVGLTGGVGPGAIAAEMIGVGIAIGLHGGFSADEIRAQFDASCEHVVGRNDLFECLQAIRKDLDDGEVAALLRGATTADDAT